MKSTIRMWLISMFSLVAVILSCGATGVDKPFEPTNEDAIYNIIRYDRTAEFNIDLLDRTIPDTTLGLSSSFRPLHFWRMVNKDSLFIDIHITYPPQGAPPDSLPVADVTVDKFFWGTLEIIGVDTTNGGSTPVRLSKPFSIKGTMTAYFVKMGFDYNTHRGWLLRNISDASYAGAYIGGISTIIINSVSYPNHAVDIAEKPLASILQFAPGETLIVNIHTPNSRDFIRFRYPTTAGVYTAIDVPNDSSQTRIVTFALPNTSMFGHFLVDVFKEDCIDDIYSYGSYSIGVLFRTR